MNTEELKKLTIEKMSKLNDINIIEHKLFELKKLKMSIKIHL